MSSQFAPGATAITGLSVTGYKSIRQEQTIEIRPLTLLAGPNGSGKSNIMQPLLLWKQTLEADYDPGALLLNGPCLRFTAYEQLLSQIDGKRRRKEIAIGVRLGKEQWLRVRYAKRGRGEVAIREMSTTSTRGRSRLLRPDMTKAEITQLLRSMTGDMGAKVGLKVDMEVVPSRCFLVLRSRTPVEHIIDVSPAEPYARQITRLVYLPGRRDVPMRTVPLAGPRFPGCFDAYTAEVILQWQATQSERVHQLMVSLSKLGLARNTAGMDVGDTPAGLHTALRTQRGGTRDAGVRVQDAGLGLSRVLPVLAALHAAEPGQLVYIEHPEIHLHPRAQIALGEELAEAALRGVRVVAETHSRLLLLAVQTVVAEGKLPAGLVKLHWFDRDARGETTIHSADLDAAGDCGNWPEDFSKIEEEVDRRYIDAAERRL